ncbi:MAG: deoxyribonuclease IV [Armatimonadetes bacterium]|nr:deoxyribonuclease IV [Armatimonadota bacterium]
MLQLGAHRATTGGLHQALISADAIGAQVVQIFTSSPMQWQARPLDDQALTLWHEARAAGAVQAVVAHDSYLVNLASVDDEVFAKSRAAYIEELRRCQALDIPYLVAHPGAHMGLGEEAGLARFAETLRGIYLDHPELTVATALETTAGQGTCLGHTFAQLAQLIAAVDLPQRVGVCLDTCHVFAAGYDVRSLDGVVAMLDEFDAEIGLDWLRVIHLNDSKNALGSRVDRHERIGRGTIGDEGFAALLGDSRVAHVPMLVETPGLEHHGEELAHLRRLAKGVEHGRMRSGSCDGARGDVAARLPSASRARL